MQTNVAVNTARALALAPFFLFACGLRLHAAVPAVLECHATNVIEVLSASYRDVTNVSFTVRREANLNDGRSARAVSRVVWARGDRLNSETLSPVPRRVIIDGTNVYDKWDGDKKPRVRPLAEQNSIQRANQHLVPCSPEEYLAEIDPVSGTDTACDDRTVARTVSFSVKSELPPDGAKGAASEKQSKLENERTVSCVVLRLDSFGRVISIMMYADDTKTQRLARIKFLAPFEAVPGGWLYGRIELDDERPGSPISDSVSRFDSIRVNQRIPAAQFDPRAFF